MVAAVPQALADKYGHWADKIPRDVLTALTPDQLAARLNKAQAHWENAAAQGETADLTKALTEAGEILAAPAPTPMDTTPSALKAAGVTSGDMDQHGRWISRIPDDVLNKMDRPSVVRRAAAAAAEYRRTDSVEAADRILTAPAYVVAAEPMTKAEHAAYQRGVREDIARLHGTWVAKVPDDVLAKLDAAELLDRCEHVTGLAQRGKANPYPGMIHGYLDQAAKVLRSLPQAEVDAEAARLEKAARLTDDQRLAQGHLARARELREDNPQAPVKARVGVVGKALRPTPPPAPTLLHKAAAGPARVRSKAATAAPKKRVPSASTRPGLDLALKALETALAMLADGTANKADGSNSNAEVAIELLDAADDLLSGRLKAA